MLSPTLSFLIMQLQSEEITRHINFVLIKSLSKVEYESLTHLLTFKTYRSGMFPDPRGDFAGLGMAPFEFNDYADVVRYRGRDNGIRLLQNSIHNSK